jgi:hypothetical protein
MQGTLKQKIFFGIILVIDCVALLPSPLIFMASIMSAADAPLSFNLLELLVRLLWLLSAFYPLYIIGSCFLGWIFVIERNKKRGYFFALFSAALSLFVITLLILV